GAGEGRRLLLGGASSLPGYYSRSAGRLGSRDGGCAGSAAVALPGGSFASMTRPSLSRARQEGSGFPVQSDQRPDDAAEKPGVEQDRQGQGQPAEGPGV